MSLSGRIDIDRLRPVFFKAIEETLLGLEHRRWSGDISLLSPVFRSIKECSSVEVLFERVDKVRDLLYGYNEDVVGVQPFFMHLGREVCVGIGCNNVHEAIVPAAALDSIVTSLVNPFFDPTEGIDPKIRAVH